MYWVCMQYIHGLEYHFVFGLYALMWDIIQVLDYVFVMWDIVRGTGFTCNVMPDIIQCAMFLRVWAALSCNML